MKIINIGGAINAGKSTVSKIVARNLEKTVFIEVDDLLSDDEDAKLADFGQRINARLDRLYLLLEQYTDSKVYEHILFAYPMTEKSLDRIKKIASGKSEVLVITLNPPLEKCLSNRGERQLNAWEANRIKEMYAQGFNCFCGSDLILDNGNDSAEETAQKVISFILRP